ncbi:MAG: permease, partial [Sphaerotilus sp.]|nr:permease [Sphaerotilus sp.]
MLAKWLRRIVFTGGLVIAGCLGGWAWLDWGLAAALGPVLALPGLNALVLGLEQVLAAVVHGHDPAPPPPGPARRGRAWWRE